MKVILRDGFFILQSSDIFLKEILKLLFGKEGIDSVPL